MKYQVYLPFDVYTCTRSIKYTMVFDISSDHIADARVQRRAAFAFAIVLKSINTSRLDLLVGQRSKTRAFFHGIFFFTNVRPCCCLLMMAWDAVAAAAATATASNFLLSR